MIELHKASKRMSEFALMLSCLTILYGPTLSVFGTANVELARKTEPQTCSELQRLVEKTYNFRLADLSQEQQRQKSEEDNAFGRFVRANPSSTVPCLATALRSPTANRYFLYSGSTLLFSMDRSEATKKLLISSLARTDLTEISFPFWLELILAHSIENYDTSAAIENWLKDARASYQISRRGPSLDRKQVFFHLIGSLDEKFATPLLAKIGSDKENPLRLTSLELLGIQATAEARAAASKIDLGGLGTLDAARIQRRFADPPTVSTTSPDPKFDRKVLLVALTSAASGKWDALKENYAPRSTDWENVAATVLTKDDAPLLRKVRRANAADLKEGSRLWYERFSRLMVYVNRK